MNRIIMVLFGVLLLLSPAVVTATPVTFDGTDGIADPFATASPDTVVTVVSETLNVGVNGTIIDLDVRIIVTGDWASEISFEISHDTVVVKLFDATVGRENSDSDVIFDDEDDFLPLGSSSEVPSFGGNGRYWTNTGGLLSDFDGYNVFGDWTLTATDAQFTAGDKNPFEWSITATTVPVATPEPGAWLLMATGLLGLAGYKRWRKNND